MYKTGAWMHSGWVDITFYENNKKKKRERETIFIAIT